MNARTADEGNGSVVESAQTPEGITDGHLTIVDRALQVQAPLARAYVRRLRAKNPGKSEEELLRNIERKFRGMLTATGAGIGGAAALPGVGTVAAVAMTVGEGAAFAEACAFLTLAAAELHGVDMRDPAKRRTVALAILGGEKGAEIITKALGKQGVQWNSLLAGTVPDFVMTAVNKQVKKWIKRRVAARMGGVWAGRMIPFGIGAVIGGAGNFMIAKSVIDAEREVFGHVVKTIEGEVVSNGNAVEGSAGHGSQTNHPS
ncbi:hypothetical protein [Devriesea agamarum]|uniref:hypothetical protein n=1 Tax=Devriesea agamarum TaxID=472569 RepID=UPI00071E60B2|nr:hypothetical protein [Devriesea agamarum]